MKLFKRIFIASLILTTIGSLSYGYIVAKSMYEKYNNTIEWKNSSLQSKIHQVPPALAQNYISIEDQKMLEILTDVNIALEEIKVNKEIRKEKFDEYWKLHEYAKSEIGKSEENKKLLTKGNFADFSLYLNADSAVKKAYENLEIEGLEEYERAFYNKLLKQNSEIDNVFLKKLQGISKDFTNLESFSKNAINKLGVIENNVLKVDIKVNKKITDELLEQIKEKNLEKFTHIKNLVNILNSQSWNEILTHNESSLNYYSWKESQKILDSLMKSNYVSVLSFNTVEDVLSYSPGIRLEEKQNHTINSDSIVKGVYYKGEKLNESLYVKKGTPLNFVIEYEYTENPKSTVTIEYVDIDGNKLGTRTQEGYVGSPIVIDKNIEGYVLLEIRNELYKFPEEDSTIQFVYEKYVPEPEPEIEEPEIDEPENNNNYPVIDSEKPNES